ncbi:hypothetical protein [Micropruina sp.]|uniref:hypothetical protein n=1 Tax=Micropruina sp. TaxID=2737536 RepID=UPI0039E62297
MIEPGERLDRLIAGADPLPICDDQEPVEHAWARVHAALDVDPVVVPLPRRWQRPAVLVGALSVALATSAAAIAISTRTGIENPAADVPLSGPGEVWRLDGTDFAARLTELSSDIPFPDQVSRRTSVSRLAAEAGEAGHDAQATTGALRGNLAKEAICAWATTWADPSTRSAATTALRGAIAWPAVTDLDPAPAVDGYPGDDGSQPTVFGYLPGIIDAAASNNAKQFNAAVDESGWCAAPTVTQAAQPEPGNRAPAEPEPTTKR